MNANVNQPSLNGMLALSEGSQRRHLLQLPGPQQLALSRAPQTGRFPEPFRNARVNRDDSMNEILWDLSAERVTRGAFPSSDDDSSISNAARGAVFEGKLLLEVFE